MQTPRYELGRRVKERGTFTGRFERVGGKDNNRLTVCLTEIRDSRNVVVADHLWFNWTKGFKSLGWLNPGDIIQFDGRVTTYLKCGGNKLDYKLSHPSQVKIVERSLK